jgi:hypothetical protein
MYIIADVLKFKPEYLVTLDKKDFFNNKVKSAIKPTLLTTPKDLLKDK